MSIHGRDGSISVPGSWFSVNTGGEFKNGLSCLGHGVWGGSATRLGAMAKSTTLAAKERIHHAVHGLGTILSVDTSRTTIAFDEAGTRTFVTSMVKFVKSDSPAPARRSSRKKKVAAAKPA